LRGRRRASFLGHAIILSGVSGLVPSGLGGQGVTEAVIREYSAC
jgi:hypothetical protein